MIIFFAGNFPLMKNRKKEEAFKRDMESRGYDYRRLVSFYFKGDIQNLIDMKGEEIESKEIGNSSSP